MSTFSAPALFSEAGLSKYLKEISRFPMLTAQEEYTLAKRWQEQQDIEAAHILVTSHLRLVAKIAMQYRGYGLPVTDLIAEGTIGLMHAVKKFDPDMGHRLSTYALWWVRASMQDHILKSWSLVKIGTSAMRKSLFFNLRKIKGKLLALEGKTNINNDVEGIAKMLNVAPYDVVEMDARLSHGDASLDTPISEDASTSLGDTIAHPTADHELRLIEENEHEHQLKLLRAAISHLAEREREIVTARLLQEPPATLDALSQHYGISRERVRQIQAAAMEKMKVYINKIDPDQQASEA
ncbi:MAG: RNA polymerase sigma factor RpoH [Proteobacteria bacterium]|nr:RNA polymerase sigma factor RpoH [Pseudomonadota bacterium]